MQDNKLYLALEADMDAVVFTEGRGIWRVVASPSMRGLADLVETGNRAVTIEPDDGADLQGIAPGPYASLDHALSAIGAYLGGHCQRAPHRRRL
jgi:hypothetical protein